MFQELLSGFLTSEQGTNALSALQSRGYSADDAAALLNHAVPAAVESMHQQTEGHENPGLGLFNIFGGHAGREFLLGAVAGLLRGDGVIGSLEDGGMGLIGGHIAEVVAERAGLDPTVAGEVAAVITPFIVHYAHDKLSQHSSVLG